MLLKANPKANIEATNGNKETALHFAALKGSVEAIEELLKANPKANIEAKNEQGNTALHYAAMYDYKDVVGELLMRGANVEVQNEQGETALDVGNDSMATFITKVLEKIKEEKKSQEIDTADTKGKARLTGRGVAVGVVLCVLVVLILLYVRIHYWRPQPTTKPF